MNRSPDRSAQGNDHSGAYLAYKAEQKGADIEKIPGWWKARNDKGECVPIPDRELQPSECRHIKAILKLMGILIPLFLVARWLL